MKTICNHKNRFIAGLVVIFRFDVYFDIKDIINHDFSREQHTYRTLVFVFLV